MSDKLQTTVIVKIIGLICLIIWIAALFITWNTPAKSYESSIYTATPVIFWVANILNLVTGISIIIYNVPEYKKSKSTLWIIGFTLVFLVFASILSLFIIRGYALWTQGDPLTHLGWVDYIVTTGHVGPELIYPITHIYLGQFSEILNVSPNIFFKCIPFIFELLGILFVYCLAKTIFPRKGQVVLVTLLNMAFLTMWYLVLFPNLLANYTLPLALFVLMKCISAEQVQWKIVFIILIFLFPIFHPLVGFVLLAIILSVWLSTKTIAKKYLPLNRNTSIYILVSAIILFIWSVIWESQFALFYGVLSAVKENLSGISKSNLDALKDLAQYASGASGYRYNVIEFGLKTYGGALIVIVIAAYCFLVSLRKGYFKHQAKNLVLWYAPLGVITCSLVLIYLTNVGFGPDRLIFYIVLFCTLYAGFILYETIETNQKIYPNRFKGKLTNIIVISILIFLFGIGIMQLYPSRYTLNPNAQTTQTEIIGMIWFFNKKDVDMKQTTMTVDIMRFASFLLTPEETANRPDISYPSAVIPIDLRIPYHFGYNQGINLGQFYRHDTYMVLSDECRLAYQDIWPEMAKIRFQPNDFNRLENDTSVDKLYSNGGFDTYYIRSYLNSY